MLTIAFVQFLPLLAAAGIGAAGSIAGSLISSRAQKRANASANAANEKRYAQALQIGREGDVIAGQYAKKGRTLLDQRVTDTAAIQTQALGEIGKIGGSARRMILRRETSANANAESSAIDRGLSATTVVDAQRRGVYDSTNNSLLDLDERLAALRSGALHTFSDAMERVTGDRASFEGEVFRSRFAALQSTLNTITGRQDVPYQNPTPNYGAIGQSLGSVAMLALMAGGAGGAGGAQPGPSYQYQPGFQGPIYPYS